jgi:hypothetical protein
MPQNSETPNWSTIMETLMEASLCKLKGHFTPNKAILHLDELAPIVGT